MAALGALWSAPALADTIRGQVLGAGAPIIGSMVTLWAAGGGAPRRLAQGQTDDAGGFSLNADAADDADLYLVAEGGRHGAHPAAGENPAIALIAVLGRARPSHVVVNEMTTVATVWTHNQFIDGTAIKGPALSLKIAAGNMPSFVDLSTGGWGEAIQGPLNSGQTPTMANFATLADALSACVVRIEPGACGKLLAAATPPKGDAPVDTLTAAEAIARYPWYRPERLFELVEDLYPVPAGETMRQVPFMPYLQVAPSAWVLPLRFDGGGYRGGGKAMFDSQGDLWVADNFTVGWQAQDALWQGDATKFDPNGKPLSPITTGFVGGGMQGGGFGAAVDSQDNAWFTTYGAKSIAVFDQTGAPLTPPQGITFGGRLGLMQGVIVTPKGDVWAVGLSKNQLVHFPGGDPNRGELVCEDKIAEPCRSFLAPFHLGVDQQDRIWVTNSASDQVVRFPAADPTKAERFKVGYSGSGLAIDGQGNVWVTNRLGSSDRGKAVLSAVLAAAVTGGNSDEVMTRALWFGLAGGGSVTLLRPDGSEYPGSPFTGGGLPAPWAAVVDGDGNVWVSNFSGGHSPFVELCGVRTETCPPGFKTGDQIAPPGGYVGGGLQALTDLAISPAGDVWLMNNWQTIDSCFSLQPEELSTRCGGQGVVIFFGMAKPVRTPQIGPAQPLE